MSPHKQTSFETSDAKSSREFEFPHTYLTTGFFFNHNLISWRTTHLSQLTGSFVLKEKDLIMKHLPAQTVQNNF